MNAITPEIQRLITNKLQTAIRSHERILASTNTTACKGRVSLLLNEVIAFLSSWEDFHNLANDLRRTLDKHEFVSIPGNIRYHRQKHFEVGEELKIALIQWDRLSSIQGKNDLAEDLMKASGPLKPISVDEFFKPQKA